MEHIKYVEFAYSAERKRIFHKTMKESEVLPSLTERMLHGNVVVVELVCAKECPCGGKS